MSGDYYTDDFFDDEVADKAKAIVSAVVTSASSVLSSSAKPASIATGNDEQVATLRDVFERCDANADGRVTKMELIKGLKKDEKVRSFTGLDVVDSEQTKDKFAYFFNALDKDSSQSISFQELRECWEQNAANANSGDRGRSGGAWDSGDASNTLPTIGSSRASRDNGNDERTDRGDDTSTVLAAIVPVSTSDKDSKDQNDNGKKSSVANLVAIPAISAGSADANAVGGSQKSKDTKDTKDEGDGDDYDGYGHFDFDDEPAVDDNVTTAAPSSSPPVSTASADDKSDNADIISSSFSASSLSPSFPSSRPAEAVLSKSAPISTTSVVATAAKTAATTTATTTPSSPTASSPSLSSSNSKSSRRHHHQTHAHTAHTRAMLYSRGRSPRLPGSPPCTAPLLSKIKLERRLREIGIQRRKDSELYPNLFSSNFYLPKINRGRVVKRIPQKNGYKHRSRLHRQRTGRRSSKHPAPPHTAPTVSSNDDSIETDRADVNSDNTGSAGSAADGNTGDADDRQGYEKGDSLYSYGQEIDSIRERGSRTARLLHRMHNPPRSKSSRSSRIHRSRQGSRRRHHSPRSPDNDVTNNDSNDNKNCDRESERQRRHNYGGEDKIDLHAVDLDIEVERLNHYYSQELAWVRSMNEAERKAWKDAIDNLHTKETHSNHTSADDDNDDTDNFNHRDVANIRKSSTPDTDSATLASAALARPGTSSFFVPDYTSKEECERYKLNVRFSIADNYDPNAFTSSQRSYASGRGGSEGTYDHLTATYGKGRSLRRRGTERRSHRRSDAREDGERRGHPVMNRYVDRYDDISSSVYGRNRFMHKPQDETKKAGAGATSSVRVSRHKMPRKKQGNDIYSSSRRPRKQKQKQKQKEKANIGSKRDSVNDHSQRQQGRRGEKEEKKDERESAFVIKPSKSDAKVHIINRRWTRTKEEEDEAIAIIPVSGREEQREKELVGGDVKRGNDDSSRAAEVKDAEEAYDHDVLMAEISALTVA